MSDFCGVGHILIKLRAVVAPPETTLDWPLQPIQSPLNKIYETIKSHAGPIIVKLENPADSQMSHVILGSVSSRALEPLKHLCIAELRPECPYCGVTTCAEAGRCDTCGDALCQHGEAKSIRDARFGVRRVATTC